MLIGKITWSVHRKKNQKVDKIEIFANNKKIYVWGIFCQDSAKNKIKTWNWTLFSVLASAVDFDRFAILLFSIWDLKADYRSDYW